MAIHPLYIITAAALIVFFIYVNWNRIMALLFPEGKSVKKIRVCPRCGSDEVQVSKISYLGDPLKIIGFVGYDCKKCGYTGRDFVTGDEEAIKKFRKELKKK
ncbi:hypothetical protein KY345_03640 [Candidatus Woesearchaeota archaeon]|nr:hypothetical protein [Candidatus Woesearchaeota archaeon]